MTLHSERPNRVLITGASGFLGGRIVEAMLLSGFAHPVGTIRHWTRAARPARFAADLQLCDILQPDQVATAVESVDAVVHCAYGGDYQSIVEGTRNLVNASIKAGIQRFVFLSTAEVYDPKIVGDVTEDTGRFRIEGYEYNNAKCDAEVICEEARNQGLNTTILRPSLIHGPFGVSWTIDVVKRLQSGKWGLFEQSNGLANLVYVDDLVALIFRCLESEAALGQTFNVNGPDKLTWNDYFSRLNLALDLPELESVSAGKSKLKTMVMDKVGWMADQVLDRFEDRIMEIYLKGGIASKLMKRLKGELDATPSSKELGDLFARQSYYCDQKARQLIGYQPRFDLEASFKVILPWLALHELAPQLSGRNHYKKQSAHQKDLEEAIR